MFRRSFNAVRLTPESFAAAEEANQTTGPLLVVMNHASWWDPLLTLVVGAKLMPQRRGVAPMDASQLRKFSFFRRIGIFGIDPDDPRSLEVLVDYAQRYTKSGVHSRPSIIVTPQGRFTDVREPIELRPGAAAVLARLCRVAGLTPPSVLTFNTEYGFWEDRKPEVFVRLSLSKLAMSDRESSEARLIVRLNRWLADGLRVGSEELAVRVRSRDPAQFRSLIARSGSAINPAYDAYLKARGHSAEIDADRAKEPNRLAGGERIEGELGDEDRPHRPMPPESIA